MEKGIKTAEDFKKKWKNLLASKLHGDLPKDIQFLLTSLTEMELQAEEGRESSRHFQRKLEEMELKLTEMEERVKALTLDRNSAIRWANEFCDELKQAKSHLTRIVEAVERLEQSEFGDNSYFIDAKRELYKIVDEIRKEAT